MMTRQTFYLLVTHHNNNIIITSRLIPFLLHKFSYVFLMTIASVRQSNLLAVCVLLLHTMNGFLLTSKNINSRKNNNIGSFQSTHGLSNIHSLKLLSAAKDSISTPPQLIQFREPKTNTKVILVGTMHYNPTSIKIVQDTIRTLGEEQSLGSVVVESCDIRWNTTMEILKTQSGKLLEPFLTSEMKVACDEAIKYGRPCVLGDQQINATGISLKGALGQTFVDICSPFNGGWGRLYEDISKASDAALPSGDGYLNARSILDPRLLIAAPVSFAKYPFSFLARNPVTTSIVLGIIFYITYLDISNSGANVAFADASLEEQLTSVVASILFAAIELIIFGKLLIQVLLAERNEIIAKNILDQCQQYSQSYNRRSKTMFPIFQIFDQTRKKNDLISGGATYVPGTIQDDVLKTKNDVIKDNNNEKVVVAILGMAHCNGIVKLLKEQRIS